MNSPRDQSLSSSTSAPSSVGSVSSHGSHQEEDDLNNPWPHLDTFFGPVTSKKRVVERGRVVYRGNITCKMCKAKVTFNTISMYTLKSHYQHVHPNQSKDLLAAITGGSKRGRSLSDDTKDSGSKRMCQASIESSIAGSAAFNNSKAQDFFHRFMVEEMLPAKIMESPSFTRFLKYLNPNFKLSSRRTYMRNLKKKAETGKTELISILDEVNYVATTADCWTAHNRSFLGMTAHWIEPSNLKRKKAILTCKELPVAHSYDILGNTMQDVHQKFDIEAKVISTTTENGANFVKAFQMFGESNSTEDPAQEDSDVDPVGVDDTEEREAVQPVDLAQLIEEEHGDTCNLPNHRRCAAHTLNLLTTVDVEKVPNWSTGNHPCFTKVKAKAEALWNKQNRKPTTAATIKREVGRKLKTPNITRWNSLYDSMEVLNEVLNTKMTQINMICMNNNMASFNQTDKDVITEYLTVMKPMVTSLDKLQSEKETYMGVLLPTLYVLRNKLEAMRSKNLKYAQLLVDYLLENPLSEEKKPKGFKARFSTLFNEMDMLMAAAIHPHFKLSVVHHLNPNKFDMVRSKLLDEVKEQAAIKSTGSNGDEEDDEEDDFFKELRTPMESTTCTRLSNKVGKELDTWCSEKEKTSKELEQGMFPVLFRAAWVEVFLKYNTAIPSSAAVERVFSQGSDLMKPKRSSLTSENFERFVFLKGNMDLLKMELEESEEL